ncbi:hypothetical protein NUW54_g9515 [Trametes sanguinea]|uniref:Uncharacterized protein n=1 Tax=Trametes sanguinea TaxID=158606 RepID=A0ACC1P837_9APHY|nr:hypothetical protein NUW54_g9515 [Trametes sanguinea]
MDSPCHLRPLPFLPNARVTLETATPSLFTPGGATAVVPIQNTVGPQWRVIATFRCDWYESLSPPQEASFVHGPMPHKHRATPSGLYSSPFAHQLAEYAAYVVSSWLNVGSSQYTAHVALELMQKPTGRTDLEHDSDVFPPRPPPSDSAMQVRSTTSRSGANQPNHVILDQPSMNASNAQAGVSTWKTLLILNEDVLIYLAAWLPKVSDLASLTFTCRHLHKALIGPLAKRASRTPFYDVSRLERFLSFLKERDKLGQDLKGCIQELNLALFISLYPEDPNGERCIGAILEILGACYALRRLRIGSSLEGDKLERVSRQIAQLSRLEELSIVLPDGSSGVLKTTFPRLLTSKRLQRFQAVPADGRWDLDISMETLPTDLEELCLPKHGRAFSEPKTHSSLRRLTIKCPSTQNSDYLLCLKEIFPNLCHLGLSAWPAGAGHRTGFDDATLFATLKGGLDTLRSNHCREWLNNGKWPAELKSVAGNPAALYVLGIPRTVEHVFILLNSDPAIMSDLMRDVVACAPKSIECHITMQAYCQKYAAGLQQFFAAFLTQKTLRSFKLTIEFVVAEERAASRDALLAVIEGLLHGASLERLLIKDTWEYLDADLCALEPADLSTRKKLLKELDTLDKAMDESAIRRFAQASPTLLWIGVDIQEGSLRSWEVKRSSGAPGQFEVELVKLQEMGRWDDET